MMTTNQTTKQHTHTHSKPNKLKKAQRRAAVEGASPRLLRLRPGGLALLDAAAWHDLVVEGAI